MISEIFSATLQILIFAFIPFLFFIIKNKKAKGFLNFIGLSKSNTKANFFAFLISLTLAVPVLLLAVWNDDFREIMIHPQSATGKIRALGFSTETMVVVMIAAIFKTAFSEELLFRGFIAKRLIAVTNYQIGNIAQAIIFGGIHTLLFAFITQNIVFLTVIFIFPSLVAYFQVYLNEKLANGSIIPGWIAHGTANVISYSFIGFLI
jgi:membrane protease YdiL (CAAX protease family)